MDMHTGRSRPATDRQLKYARDLMRQRDDSEMLAAMPPIWREVYDNIRNQAGNVVAMQDASRIIDQLKKCPAKSIGQIVLPEIARLDRHEAAKAQVRANTQQPLEDGMYRRKSDGTIFKVYHTVHGNNIQAAKRLIVINNYGGTADVKFHYEGRKPLYTLTPADRLTEAEAADFGRLYGVCCICGRTLTNEVSIELGIGPVCGRREFGGEFEFKIEAAKVTVKARDNDITVTDFDIEDDEEAVQNAMMEKVKELQARIAAMGNSDAN